MKAFNLSKDVVTQSAELTEEQDAVLQESVQCSFMGQACASAAAKGKDKIENLTYVAFESMQFGAIRLELQGHRKMAMCRVCDICSLLIEKQILKAMESFVRETPPSSRRSCLSGVGSQGSSLMKWARADVRYTTRMSSRVI